MSIKCEKVKKPTDVMHFTDTYVCRTKVEGDMRQSMGKPGQSRQAKFGEKGKSKKSKDAHLIHFIHPKVQKYIQKCLKFIQKYLKITFFPSFARPTFQNVITHRIFEIL
jgi:hypothetical protein